MTEHLSKEPFPPEIQESLEQADRDLAAGRTKSLREVLAELSDEDLAQLADEARLYLNRDNVETPPAINSEEESTPTGDK